MKNYWIPTKKIAQFSTIFSLCAVAACTAQKREDQFIPNMGKDLFRVSDINNKHFIIQTLDTTIKTVDSEVTTPSEQKNDTKLTANTTKKIVNLPLVNIKSYGSLPDLLSKVSFQGHPDHTYDGFYKLTDKALMIYKAGPAHDLDFNEITSASPIKDGQLAVPMISYSVSYFIIEKLKNADNEVTNQLKEVAVDSLSKATHLRVDKTQFEVFQPQPKPNLFPKDYFSDNWHFAKPTQSPSLDESVNLFKKSVQKTAIETESKNLVKFLIDENSLKVVDSQNESSILLTLPVQWIDFELKEIDSQLISKEQQCSSKKWEDRRFIQFHPPDATTVFSQPSKPITTQIVTVDREDNYFSFVISEIEETTKKDSFKRYIFFKNENPYFSPKPPVDTVAPAL